MSLRLSALLLLAGFAVACPAQQPGEQAPAQPAASAAPVAAPDQPQTKAYTLPEGTKILLSLRSEVNTRTARVGDTVYLDSNFPVIQGGAVVLPAGLYVKGVVDEVARAGKAKGRAQLQLHFTSIIFPNGVEIPVPGSLDKLHGVNNASVKDGEGHIEANSTKGKDAQSVVGTTMEGGAIGGLVGWGTGDVGKGTGIGAGAGAAVGIVHTLFKRGDDIVIPQGSTIEMVLQRPLQVQEQQLQGMPQFTGLAPAAMTPVDAQQTPEPMPKPAK